MKLSNFFRSILYFSLTRGLFIINDSIQLASYAVRGKRPYSEFFWSVFSRIRTEYSVPMRENTDQKNSEYGRFSRSDADDTTP